MRCIFLVCVLVFLSSSIFALSDTSFWDQVMAKKLKEYDGYSREKLAPYFSEKNLPYAPKELAFLIFKDTKKFEVYARQSHFRRWKHVKTYHIYAASGGAGPKLHEGDHQVPEGIYHIIGLNPASRFDLSMHLNYPNHFDRLEAKNDHRHHLGSNIFIHGNRRSIGCIALGDKAIEQLFPLVHAVGERHITVVIAPNDLRKALPVYSKEHMRWMPALYARLSHKLAEFPIV